MEKWNDGRNFTTEARRARRCLHGKVEGWKNVTIRRFDNGGKGEWKDGKMEE
jgi:hypothetical protein